MPFKKCTYYHPLYMAKVVEMMWNVSFNNKKNIVMGKWVSKKKSCLYKYTIACVWKEKMNWAIFVSLSRNSLDRDHLIRIYYSILIIRKSPRLFLLCSKFHFVEKKKSYNGVYIYVILQPTLKPWTYVYVIDIR